MPYIERDITTSAELLPALELEWDALTRVAGVARKHDLVERTDPAGWSSKDYLAHLATWSRSVILMVRDGTPRWEGLGIPKDVFDADDWSEKNEVIRQNSQDASLDDVMSDLEHIQREIVEIVQTMPDEELQRPVADFAEGGWGETLIHRIVGTFPDHYEEHRNYIEHILEG